MSLYLSLFVCLASTTPYRRLAGARLARIEVEQSPVLEPEVRVLGQQPEDLWLGCGCGCSVGVGVGQG